METKEEKQDKLDQAVQLCQIHCERMNFARGKLQHYFPLTRERFLQMEPEKMSYFDQLIFRFSKLQDSMGKKLFPSLLNYLEEDTRGIPFIDILEKLEELQFLESKDKWIQLRETRNIVTHEYPFVTQEVIDGLNLLNNHSRDLSDIWKLMKGKIRKVSRNSPGID